MSAARRHLRAPRPRRRAEPVRRGLWLSTMGGFAVQAAGRPLGAGDFERRTARALLAALLCAGEPVHREQLLEWFWPSLAPRRGLACLFTTLYALRRALEPELRAGAGSAHVRLDGESYRLELGAGGGWDGELILRAARPGAPALGAQAVLALERAEALCRGSFLPEWRYEEWARGRRAEIEEAAQTLVARLAEAELARGRPERAIPRFRRLVAGEPEREAWHRGLMRAYAQAGERGLALGQYHACRALLGRRQGSAPSPQTAELYAALLRAEIDLVGEPRAEAAAPAPATTLILLRREHA